MDVDPRYTSDEEEDGAIHSLTDTAAVWRSTFLMAGVSLVLNVILFFVGRAADWIPDDMPDSTQTFSLVSVVLASVIPVLLFGALMAYLGKHAPRASRLFTIIVLVVLILAVVVPMTLPDLENSFRFLLVAMHIVTAGSILVLTRLPEN